MYRVEQMDKELRFICCSMLHFLLQIESRVQLSGLWHRCSGYCWMLQDLLMGWLKLSYQLWIGKTGVRKVQFLPRFSSRIFKVTISVLMLWIIITSVKGLKPLLYSFYNNNLSHVFDLTILSFPYRNEDWSCLDARHVPGKDMPVRNLHTGSLTNKYLYLTQDLTVSTWTFTYLQCDFFNRKCGCVIVLWWVFQTMQIRSALCQTKTWSSLFLICTILKFFTRVHFYKTHSEHISHSLGICLCI